jgi:hypothetical protein
MSAALGECGAVKAFDMRSKAVQCRAECRKTSADDCNTDMDGGPEFCFGKCDILASRSIA